MANRLFFLLMAASSALALLRGFVLAGILPVDGFGRYAMLFAIGTFAASLLSFGMIERSFKRFPRLCVDGHTAWALNEADRIAKKLGGRAVLAIAICSLILLLASQAEWLVAALLALQEFADVVAAAEGQQAGAVIKVRLDLQGGAFGRHLE